MPLAFTSLSHGTVAFGFYNIETDGLLLDRMFFFCSDLCRAVCDLDRALPGETTSGLPGFVFDDPARVGDLMGAIRGVRHVGYLGEIYRLWPFPTEPGGFRQKVEGDRNRHIVERTLRNWARATTVRLTFDAEGREYRIGAYAFSPDGYLELLNYIWRGGYPTWEGIEDGRRPACVTEMRDARERLARLAAGAADE